MIDTIVLQVNLMHENGFSFLDNSYYNWTPNIKGVVCPPFYGFEGHYRKFVNNPTQKQTNEWGYLPRLTLCETKVNGELERYLYIEFSAPKIVFGNNFSELSDGDLENFCHSLMNKLYHMGIHVYRTQAIKECQVKAIHYSKNIVFTDGTTPSSVIRLFQKSNISTHRNTNESKYKNGGESYNSYTLDSCFCAYDKRKELQRTKLSRRGRIEKDSYCQLDLLDSLTLLEPFQVLRLERRFESKKSLTKGLEELGMILPTLTLENLFKAEIAKQVLASQLSEIERSIPNVVKNTQRYADTMESLTVLNPKASLSLKLKAIGLKALMHETNLRDLRQIIRSTDKQWSRLIEDLEKLKIPENPIPILNEVNRQLEVFEPLRLEDHIDKMIEIDIQ